LPSQISGSRRKINFSSSSAFSLCENLLFGEETLNLNNICALLSLFIFQSSFRIYHSNQKSRSKRDFCKHQKSCRI